MIVEPRQIVVSNKLTFPGKSMSVTALTVVVVETSHPFASVTFTVYSPGIRLLIEELEFVNPEGPIQSKS